MMRAKLSPRVGIARQENNRRGTTLDADGGARGTKEFTSGSSICVRAVEMVH